MKRSAYDFDAEQLEREDVERQRQRAVSGLKSHGSSSDCPGGQQVSKPELLLCTATMSVGEQCGYEQADAVSVLRSPHAQLCYSPDTGQVYNLATKGGRALLEPLESRDVPPHLTFGVFDPAHGGVQSLHAIRHGFQDCAYALRLEPHGTAPSAPPTAPLRCNACTGCCRYRVARAHVVDFDMRPRNACRVAQHCMAYVPFATTDMWFMPCEQEAKESDHAFAARFADYCKLYFRPGRPGAPVVCWTLAQLLQVVCTFPVHRGVLERRLDGLVYSGGVAGEPVQPVVLADVVPAGDPRFGDLFEDRGSPSGARFDDLKVLVRCLCSATRVLPTPRGADS